MKTDTQALAPHFACMVQQRHAAILGVWIFLATELMLFGPLFFGYLYGRLHFPAAFGAASRHADIVLGTLNTAVLLTSSLTMALAVEACRHDAQYAARRLLWATAALGAAFLSIKGIEYAHDWHAHLFPGPAFSFSGPAQAQLFFVLYFAMTGLHALHLVIGIALAAAFAIGLGNTAFADAGRVELAGLYWHLVDVIWIFLYPILYLIDRAGG